MVYKPTSQLFWHKSPKQHLNVEPEDRNRSIDQRTYDAQMAYAPQQLGNDDNLKNLPGGNEFLNFRMEEFLYTVPTFSVESVSEDVKETGAFCIITVRFKPV